MSQDSTNKANEAAGTKVRGWLGFAVLSGLLIALTVALGWGWIVLWAPLLADRLPRGWNVKDLARAAMKEGEVAADARILTWRIDEDDRPLTVESAIVWLRFDGSGKRRWVLAHLYRHPRDSRPKWLLSWVSDAPFTPRMEFDHPPQNAEVYEFLRETWWEFGPKDGFRLLDAAVCAGTWKAVIGQEPTEDYARRGTR
jgi:hypothetical protein